jgi:hypothetical protein
MSLSWIKTSFQNRSCPDKNEQLLVISHPLFAFRERCQDFSLPSKREPHTSIE